MVLPAYNANVFVDRNIVEMSFLLLDLLPNGGQAATGQFRVLKRDLAKNFKNVLGEVKIYN